MYAHCIPVSINGMTGTVVLTCPLLNLATSLVYLDPIFRDDCLLTDF